MNVINIHEMYLQLVQKSTLSQRYKIKTCQFLKNSKRYRVQNFIVHKLFNDLSNDILLILVAQNFLISTCLRYVDITDFVKVLEHFDKYKV